MLILKYQKLYPSCLAGHVDTLRTLTGIFRRAKLNVEYSKGFNPHMEIFVAQATSLGTESLAEYVAVKTKDDTALGSQNTATKDFDILKTLNAVCPKGLKFLTAFCVQNVNLASIINKADYEISSTGISRFVDQLLDKDFCITYTDKNGTVTKNVADKIFSVQAMEQNTLKVCLACGQTNLRPDRLVVSLLSSQNVKADYKILKTTAYINSQPVDDYLKSLLV